MRDKIIEFLECYGLVIFAVLIMVITFLLCRTFNP